MPSDWNIPISRRHHLGLCGTALAGILLSRDVFAEPAATASPNLKFQAAYDALADQMRRLYEICRVKVDGRELLRPCASPYYNGLWHDDFTWPHIGLPELQKSPVLRDSITSLCRIA